MFKRAFILVMASLFALNVFADVDSGIKEVFDEFFYTMDIEGAAVNSELRAQAYHLLAIRIDELKVRGVSNEEIFDYALSQSKDRAAVRDIKVVLSNLQLEKLSPEEAHQMLKNIMERSNAKGAS